MTKILFPRNRRTIVRPASKSLCAVVRAKKGAAVTASLTIDGGPSLTPDLNKLIPPAPGRPRRNHDLHLLRFVHTAPIPPNRTLTLTVKTVGHLDKTITFEVENVFTLAAKAEAERILSGVTAISSHVHDQDITDQIDTFVAFGTLAPNVDLIEAYMSGTPADFIFSSPDATEGFWAAQFPPLGPGVYSLLVRDAANNIAACLGLFAD